MPEHVVLDGGLDLVSARPATLPGRIRECLNYEVGFRRGYARIDGLERYDGRTSPSSTDAWRYYMVNADITGVFAPVEVLTWSKEDRTGEAGVLLLVEDASTHKGLFIFFRSTSILPPDGATVTGNESGASFVVDYATQDIRKMSTYYGDHDTYLSSLDNFASLLRAEIGPVPGVGSIVGLHFHEDTLYSVRDVVEVVLQAGDESILKPGMYVYLANDQVGEVLAVDVGTRTVSITAIDQNGFSPAALDTLSVALAVRFKTGLGSFTVGDAIEGDTSTWVGDVGVVSLRDGGWESGNALGAAGFINGTDAGQPVAAETVSNTTDGTSTLEIESILFNASADAVTIESVNTQSEMATMWQSSGSGWQPVTKGRLLPFDTGTNDPLGAALPYTLTCEANASKKYATGDLAWTGTYSNIEGAPDGVGISCSPYVNTALGFGVLRDSDWLKAYDFRVGVLDGDTITGLEIQFTCRNGNASASAYMKGKLEAGTTYGSVAVPLTTYGTVSVGGDGKLWGQALTPELVNSADFGVVFQGWCGTTAIASLDLDCVRLKVYATSPPGGKLYLYDTTTAADIGYVFVESVVEESGTWAGNDAVGYLRVSDWSVISVPEGTEIWTGAGGTGSFIANVTSNLSIPSLPGSTKLAENNSRYQFMSYNFYASEEQNAVYGVSGAGPAFFFDGETLDFIYTGVDAEKDLPRHLAPHQGRLALGYVWGEVYVSSSTSPLEFDALTLASSHGFGDKITGLMPINGLALGVFTESTISVLLGAALDSEGTGVEQKVVNPKSGAIEYTVQNLGNIPIFADFRGVSMLTTTDQYGDFAPNRLTHDANPWLLDRLQRKAGYETVDRSVVNSMVVRNKNQYRLFFADGELMTLTLFGAEQTPMVTLQKYWLSDDETKYCRVMATASGVTSDGRDRAFMSVENRFDIDMLAEASYVYELDRGVSFDGDPIEAFLQLTQFFDSKPEAIKRFSAMQVHGYVAGVANFKISRSVNYEDLDEPLQGNEPMAMGSGQHPPEGALVPKYAITRLSARGFAMTLRIDHVSKVEFPHVLQLVSFVDDEALRLNR